MLMIIILKIILSLFIIMDIYVAKVLYKDFKITESTVEYEDSTVMDKIKLKAVLYTSLVGVITFCLVLLYYVVVPMQISS